MHPSDTVVGDADHAETSEWIVLGLDSAAAEPFGQHTVGIEHTWFAHGQYHCMCGAEWAGFNCDRPATPCSMSPCQNGGTCSEVSDDAFSCECSSGYAGQLCATESAWTVIMKTNGDSTFQYDAEYWGDSRVLNVQSDPLDPGNAKYEAYNSLTFSSVVVCVNPNENEPDARFDPSFCLVPVDFSTPFMNAAALFDGSFRREGVDQAEWVSAFQPSGHRSCGMQRPGFNTVCRDNNRARWGFCNNIPNQNCQTSDGDDADAAIGVGLHGQDCCPIGAGYTNYFVSNTPDSGREKRVQAWILVADTVGATYP